MPVRIIPPELYNDFTLNRQIKVIDYYFDDSNKDVSHHYTKENVETLIQKAKQKQPISYHNTDQYLYAALDTYGLQCKNVVVMGSEFPAYESVVLAYGGNATIIEYNKRNLEFDGLKYVSAGEYKPGLELFDVALSISSFEHDGLGRYGDPIDPYADIKAMKSMKNIVKKDGLMFLAVPVGSDILYWNGMRQYGPIRFPMLINEWSLVDCFGFVGSDLYKEYFSTTLLTGEVRWNYHQPVIVLRNV